MSITFGQKIDDIDIAMVELEEGPLIPTNIVDVEPDPSNLTIGMPVEVTYEDITDTITLPKFKPV